jgi:hypothetical protein
MKSRVLIFCNVCNATVQLAEAVVYPLGASDTEMCQETPDVRAVEDILLRSENAKLSLQQAVEEADSVLRRRGSHMF